MKETAARGRCREMVEGENRWRQITNKAKLMDDQCKSGEPMKGPVL